MKKGLKITFIILLCVVIILLVINSLFGYLIKSQLEKFTNESITLDYKNSKARLLVGSIEFNEASLLFKDVSIDSNSSIFIESISFEKFALTHLSLKDLLFNRSFNIEKVLLSGPTIDFLKDTTIRPKDIFTKVLTPNVLSSKSQSAPFSFDVGELEIDRGSFKLMEAAKSDFSLGSVNLKLNDISMEDLKLLNGEAPDLNAKFNIRLSIFDIQKQIDSTSSFTIDSVVYKKDKKLIDIGGIKVNGIKTESNYAESELNIATDLISVNGFSLSHLLSTNDLKFNKLTISNPELFEKFKYFNEKKISSEKAESKGQLLNSVINAFITDTFYIKNANYRSLNLANDSADFVKNLDLQVYSVRVDSNFIIQKEFLKPIEKSTIQSGPINMHIPDLGFDISCDTMLYYGPGKEQMFVNLNVKKYPALFSDDDDKLNIHFESDSIIIWGLDEREWEDSADVNFSLYIKAPQVYGSGVNFGKSSKSKSKSFDFSKIVLSDLNLVNGSIYIEGTEKELIEVGSLNIDVDKLQLFSNNNQNDKTINWESIESSIENSKYYIPGKVKLELTKGEINNNDFDFEGFSFSEIHRANNYTVSSKRLPDTTRVFTKKLTIDNFDVKDLINQKMLVIGKLEIIDPTFFHYSASKQKKDIHPDSLTPLLFYKRINKLLPNYFSLINIADIEIKNADVIYNLEKDNLMFHSNNSFSLQNILFDQQLPDGEIPELIIDKYGFCLNNIKLVSDNLHFTSESFCYNNRNNKLDITNSHAENKKIGNDSTILFNVTFPKIELTEPDFNPRSGGPFSFNMLNIIEPDIYLHIPGNKNQKKSKNDSPELLPFTFLEDGIIITKGNVQICLDGKSKSDSTTIIIEQIDFSAHDLYKIVGGRNYKSGDRNLFSYLDFSLNNISMIGPGMNLNVNALNYDKTGRIISIDRINNVMYSVPDKPAFYSSVEVPQIKIEQPDLMLVSDKVKSYGAVNFIIPDIEVNLETAAKEKTSDKKETKLAVNDSTFRNFLGKVDFFHIDSINFTNIGISHSTISDTTGGSLDIERISFLVDKLKIDSSHFDSHQKRIAKDIILQLHDREVVTADSMYRLNVGNITYFYSRDKIVIDSFDVSPRFERSAFFEKAKFQTDLMQVKFESAVAEGIDLLSIIESKKLNIDKLTLNKLSLKDHRDQHYPRKENDFKKLPQQSLFELPFVLKIDTVKVKESYLLYGEYLDKSPKPGEIHFANLDALLFNVTNVRSTGENKDSIFVHLTADIMDKSPMKIDLTIPLEKENDNFWLKGSVEDVDLTEFNSMTENLFGISVLRGRGSVEIPKINFNDIHSTGSMIFEYKKLKLALYNRNKAKLNRGLGSGLVDFLMNGVLIKSNNPTFLGKTRTGDIYFERNLERSFFNYLWKSTMSGLTATMGFYNKEQRVEKKERKGEEKIERKDERHEQKSNK